MKKTLEEHAEDLTKAYEDFAGYLEFSDRGHSIIRSCQNLTLPSKGSHSNTCSVCRDMAKALRENSAVANSLHVARTEFFEDMKLIPTPDLVRYIRSFAQALRSERPESPSELTEDQKNSRVAS